MDYGLQLLNFEFCKNLKAAKYDNKINLKGGKGIETLMDWESSEKDKWDKQFHSVLKGLNT